MDHATAHALLRDRQLWRGAMSGLALAVDREGAGDLVLAGLPAPANGKAVTLPTTLPYAREVSGLAAGPCNALFVADTAHDRVLYIDGLCDARTWLPAYPSPNFGAPGHFKAPRGLVCTDGALLVADSGNARVQRLAWPQLEAHLAWGAWGQPMSLAIDSQHRVLVVDAAGAALHRMQANGDSDIAFDSAAASSGVLLQPLFVAVDDDDRVLVSDAQRNEVVLFDSSGTYAGTLPGPSGWLPGALACTGSRVYVANAADGSICVFDSAVSGAVLLCTLGGWSGPVTALASGDDGSLWIKPDLNETVHHFEAGLAHVPQGTLTTGPFDAGESLIWERAWADAAQPGGTQVQIEVAVAASSTPPPGPADWLVLPATDVLLSQMPAPAGRYAWLRITLSTTLAGATPRVQQARLATAAEDYLDHLPLTYRLNDDDSGDAGADGFLSRWLRLIRGEFMRVEQTLEDVPRLADPQFEAPGSLAWLAQWLGLELPQIASDAERRVLLARAVELFVRRGSKASIAEFVKLHTGIEPAIVEAFAERRVWVLGTNSLLDFDTRLPGLDPLGLVLPDLTMQAGCCPAEAAPADAACSPCASRVSTPAAAAPVVPIGRAIVGESGPLAEDQMGLPLFSEEAYRFCVVVDAYRAHDPQTLQEIARIVDREKPAHTDYRIELVQPDMRVGFQARIGIDTLVGGDPPPWRVGDAALNLSAHLPTSRRPRIGEAVLDGALTLN